MNVSVVGSYRKKARLSLSKEEFREACEAIGGKLAELGHTLIVPHPKDRETAEVWALKGFRAVGNHKRFRCIREHPGDPVLKAHFDAVEKSDAVILIGGQSGTYASGLLALHRRKLIVPITVFGGSASELCSIPEIDNIMVDQIRNLDAAEQSWLDDLTGAIESILNAFPHILIIHGRGDSGQELKERIVEASNTPNSPLFGVAQPLIMDLTGKGAVSLPKEFEDLASQVFAAIAIVTADDVGGFARSEGTEYSAKELKLEPRARENVWVEVGWFWGRLGRERVFLWRKDELNLPTDLQGAAWTGQASIDKAWKSIEAFIKRLREAR
jgi:hypothetical protein